MSDCKCQYPEVKMDTLSGHSRYCPVNVRTIGIKHDAWVRDHSGYRSDIEPLKHIAILRRETLGQ